jgi:uncharacterized membrane protein (UPF0127 family)
MAWLMSDARVLASADVAADRRARMKGLIGRTSLEGALVIPHCRWVHTLGMRFAIDIAYVDADGVVTKTATIRPWRLSMPVPRARQVVEAQAGSFERWGLHVGDVLEVRASDPNPVP